jgi:hypothetical protein
LSKATEDIPLEPFFAEAKFTSQTTLRYLKVHLQGLVKVKQDSIHIPKDKRMQLVKKAISIGVGIDQLVETLHWREFENFCLIVFDYHGFQTVQNFHYSYNKKRREIDVVAMKKPLLFAIDAKKWKTGHASALKTMVKNQIQRVKVLGDALRQPKMREKLGINDWRSATLIPMIVTSKSYDIRIFQEVPILPFFKLNPFINDYHRYAEMILHLPVNLYRRKADPVKSTLIHYLKGPKKSIVN